jgi:CheY-like chemotaxis protein
MTLPLQPCGRHPGTILVVDEDPTMLMVLRESLTEGGYRGLGVLGVDRALAILRAFRVDLVLTDALLVRGGRDPWAKLDLLRERAGATSVVILSTHAERSFADCIEHGFASLIAKTFDLDHLYDAIRQAIVRKGAS